ncbi:MAG: hypothetical protein Q9201_001108 [Fulgogasparrea decipioides]
MAAPLRMLSHTWLPFRPPQRSLSAPQPFLKYLQASSPCLRHSFSTTLRHNVAKKARTPPKTYQPPVKLTKAPATNTYKPFAQTLAERSNPTVLYQSSSHTTYKVGCYSIGILMFGWVLHAVNQISNYPPKNFPVYLKSLFYGICFIAGGMGLLFFLRPFRIIQSIVAIPTILPNGARTLRLQIESTRMFPGIRPKTVTAPATSIHLSSPLFQQRSGGVPLRALEERRLAQERASRLNQGNLFLLPFRQLRFLFWKGWRVVKGVFTNSPFIYLRVQGYNGTWKLGQGSGWALEEGRAIDRVVKYSVTA